MKSAWPLFLALAFAGAGVAFSQSAAPPQGTVTITMPKNVGPGFKEGPGVEAAREYCTTCHAPAYVAIQAPMTGTQWTAEVTKMQRVFGAEIPANAAAAIVQYLTAEYGRQ
jgi:hypothetical protein